MLKGKYIELVFLVYKPAIHNTYAKNKINNNNNEFFKFVSGHVHTENFL